MTSFPELHWTVFGLQLTEWILGAILAYIVLQWILPIFTRRIPGEIDDVILGILKWPIIVLIIAEGIVQSLTALGVPEGTADLVEHLFRLVLIWVAAFFAVKLFSEVFGTYGEKYAQKTDSNLDDVLLPVVNALGPIVVFVGATLATVAWALGVDLALFFGILGGLGFIIAFVFQDILQNLFAGAYLLVGNPFRFEDFVELEDKIYRVKHIGARTTELYDIDRHVVVYVPNSVIAGQKIANLTKPNVELKVSIEVGVAYATDLVEFDLEALLKNIANAQAHVLGRLEDKLAATVKLSQVSLSYIQSLLQELAGESQLVRYRTFLANTEQRVNEIANETPAQPENAAPDSATRAMLGRWLFEYLLREDVEHLSRELFLTAKWVSEEEKSGWTLRETEEFKTHIAKCQEDFDALRRMLTIWLQVVQAEGCLYEWDRDDLDIPNILDFVQIVSEKRVPLLGALEDGEAEAIGSIPALVRLMPGGQSEWVQDQVAVQAWMRAYPYADQLYDYLDLYARYHRTVRHIDKKLQEWAKPEKWHKVGREFRIDDEIVELEREWVDQLPTPIPHWKRPDVSFMPFGASSLDFRLDFFVDDIVGEHFGRQDDTLTEIRFQIVRQFAKHGIEIPFPQQDVWFRNALKKAEGNMSSAGSSGS